jgi:hypothetical protein
MSDDNRNKQQIKVRYTETSSLYSSQFILNSSEEDITINFSSGPLVDPASGDTMLPIHTRIALTREGARRLHGILGKVLSEQADRQQLSEAAQMQMPKIKH